MTNEEIADHLRALRSEGYAVACLSPKKLESLGANGLDLAVIEADGVTAMIEAVDEINEYREAVRLDYAEDGIAI